MVVIGLWYFVEKYGLVVSYFDNVFVIIEVVKEIVVWVQFDVFEKVINYVYVIRLNLQIILVFLFVKLGQLICIDGQVGYILVCDWVNNLIIDLVSGVLLLICNGS